MDILKNKAFLVKVVKDEDNAQGSSSAVDYDALVENIRDNILAVLLLGGVLKTLREILLIVVRAKVK